MWREIGQGLREVEAELGGDLACYDAAVSAPTQGSGLYLIHLLALKLETILPETGRGLGLLRCCGNSNCAAVRIVEGTHLSWLEFCAQGHKPRGVWRRLWSHR